MTRRRWIADRVEGDRAYLLDQNANHLFRVLRVKSGQEFEVVAEGVVRLGTVIFASEHKVEFHLGEEFVSPELPEISVYLSIFKFDRLEWALEKLTELGVAKVTPVIAARTGQHLIKAAGTRMQRWRKIVHEAAQQSRRAAPPGIAEPAPLGEAVAGRRCRSPSAPKADGPLKRLKCFNSQDGNQRRWAAPSCGLKPRPSRRLLWWLRNLARRSGHRIIWTSDHRRYDRSAGNWCA